MRKDEPPPPPPPMDIIRKEPNEENIMRVVVIMRATERERARDSFGNIIRIRVMACIVYECTRVCPIITIHGATFLTFFNGERSRRYIDHGAFVVVIFPTLYLGSALCTNMQ
jgi:hypothetical protein